MIVVDNYLDMNDASADGTPLTTTILANGTIGAGLTWSVSPIPPPPFQLGTHRIAILDEIKVGSTVYPIGHASKAVKYDHATAGAIYGQAVIPTGKLAITMAGHITFGPPDAGVGGQLFDYCNFYEANTGDSVTLQLLNGNSPGGKGYALNIETNWDGEVTHAYATSHSPYITIVPGVTYWCCMQGNWLSGIARLNVYSADGGTLIGAVQKTQSSLTAGSNTGTAPFTGVAGAFVDRFKWGNNEVGVAAGTFSYWENFVLDYNSAKFPIVPAFSSLVPIRRGNRSRRRFIAQQD